MKYILLVYNDEQYWEALSHSERDILGRACLDNNAALHHSGHLLAMERLQSSRSAATVRVQSGKLWISDGPCAETNEQLISMFTIDAKDLNAAIQVAATMPQARGGPIEIRPVVEVDTSTS